LLATLSRLVAFVFRSVWRDVDPQHPSGRGHIDSGLATFNLRVTGFALPLAPTEDKIDETAMPLSVGTRVGPYEIVAPLGSGGMGEVYRAHDPKLNRDVAIKVLPAALSNDADYMARFQREAQVLASLNHPNIAAIYGLEDHAIVMELVEGPTLADQLARNPLSIEEALPIAKQIAEALEAAHEKGIIHRDLKPGNIKIALDGIVKVLDFGLAKTSDVGSKSDASISPTLTIRATEAGLILGTAAYMAPEQAAGKLVDKRADIWSFGVVVWEMLTGKLLFEGETVSHTLAHVLTAPIDFTQLPPQTPHAIGDLLRRCLDRNVKSRLRDIGEARVALEDPRPAEPKSPIARAPSRRSRLWPTLGAALALIALALSFVLWRITWRVASPLMQLSVDLGPDAILGGLSRVAIVISPDGRRLVYLSRGTNAKQQLSTRLFDQEKSAPLIGTENAEDPFFSPDGQWIGFFANGKLKKISVQGGAAVTLCDVPNDRGGSWGVDGNIVLAVNSRVGLSRIPAAGGMLQPLTKLDQTKGETTHRFPQVLPGAKAVLFTAGTVNGDFSAASIDAVSLKTGERKTLQRGAFFGRYLPTGHLVYVHGDTLFIAPMNLDRLELTGPAVPWLPEVANYPVQAGAQFDFSQGGAFVFVSGRGLGNGWSMMWLDSQGKVAPLKTEPGFFLAPSFSPDGNHLAFSLGLNDGEISVYDWQRDTTSRLSFTPPPNNFPVWTPDGRGVVYRSDVGSVLGNLYWVRSDGAVAAVPLTESRAGRQATPYSFSPDGKRLAYHDLGGEAAGLWTLPIDWSDPNRPRAGQPEEFLRGPFSMSSPAFSPDGRWIAYSAQEGSVQELYVRPFPPAPSGGRWQISSGGARYPIWSRKGRELFYENLDGQILVVNYTASGETFNNDKPRLWSDHRTLNNGNFKNYDLAPDGKRFAIVEPLDNADQRPTTHVNLLLNYVDEVRRRAPAGTK
jgi:serine/threonine-protein kinase